MSNNNEIKRTFNVEDSVLLYTNSFNINASAYDFTFKFYREERTDETNIILNQVAELIMSPQLAKDLINILSGVVESYETDLGKINVVKK